MSRPSPAQAHWAKSLLALERGNSEVPDDHAEVAARVHAKLRTGLSPLLGTVGVDALLRRSATLAKARFATLAEPAAIDSSTTLLACLRAQDPAIALELAAFLFGAFFELLETFIGRRLTNQLLRGTWPSLEGTSLPVADDEETHR